jgi:NAD(P)-dependent dehydrogenase (short-subunit alcohol dehydrogenase family)
LNGAIRFWLIVLTLLLPDSQATSIFLGWIAGIDRQRPTFGVWQPRRTVPQTEQFIRRSNCNDHENLERKRYAASKAGLIGLTKALAADLGSKAIRVNAILPGGTDTPASITNAPGAGPGVLAFVEGLHALKRLAKPEEIARSVLHLASDASRFITGTALLVDGGVSINRT